VDWYALLVKPQHEKSVHLHLSSLGIESFLPLYRTRRRSSNRIRELDLPLFPGYVFCRFAIHQKRTLFDVPGVRSIVASGNEPAAIPVSEIEHIQAVIRAGLPVRPWPYMEFGERVRIESGPLRGAQGVLLKVRKVWQLVLGVEALRRAVIAGLDPAAVSTHASPRQFGTQESQIACR
jgi:transcription antitermination factor NusG